MSVHSPNPWKSCFHLYYSWVEWPPSSSGHWHAFLVSGSGTGLGWLFQPSCGQIWLHGAERLAHVQLQSGPLGRAIFAVISGLWSHVREEKSLHPGIMAQSPSFSRCRWVPMCSMNLTRVHLGTSNYRPCSFSSAGGHSDPPPICQFSSPSSQALGKWGFVRLSRGRSSESRAETGRSRGKDEVWKRGNTWMKYFHFAFLEAGCRNAKKFHLRKSQSETVHAWLPVQVDRTSC